jgi:hypothetical protein
MELFGISNEPAQQHSIALFVGFAKLYQIVSLFIFRLVVDPITL